jgi:hypothetical protein
MFLLLMVPVVVVVAAVHGVLQRSAPSNVLIARARESESTVRACIGLVTIGLALVIVAHGLSLATQRGGPGWLNLLVLVLLWDGIKFVTESALVVCRWFIALCRSEGRGALQAKWP